MFKKFNFTQNKKSYGIVSQLSLLGTGQQTHSTSFIGDYVKSSPVFIATKLIADAIAGIPILLKDSKNDELIYQHEALEILRNPSPFCTKTLLMKELASFYVLTGNAYLKIIGSNKPVEISSLNPKGMNITAARDGYPGAYEYTTNMQTEKFTRDSRRFLDPMNNELAHLRDFNPDYSSENLVGYSAFSGCILEIMQGIAANIHNNALLKNQARPSGLLTFAGKDVLDDDQVREIQGILKQNLSGAANAGKTTFLNGEFKWQQLSESMKDMDFPTLKKDCAEVIFKAAKIPLPMISPDNMSFANMDSAKFAFYDNAALPVLKEILALFNQKILIRYKGVQNLEYWFDESAIESLQLRKLDYAKNLYQSGIGTRDEARTQIGYEPSINQEDGDSYYRSNPNINIGNESSSKAVEQKEYVRLMKELRGLDGKRLYDDELIKKNVKLYYG